MQWSKVSSRLESKKLITIRNTLLFERKNYTWNLIFFNFCFAERFVQLRKTSTNIVNLEKNFFLFLSYSEEGERKNGVNWVFFSYFSFFGFSVFSKFSERSRKNFFRIFWFFRFFRNFMNWVKKNFCSASLIAIKKHQNERQEISVGYEKRFIVLRILVCDLDKQCGFGCQLHHAAYCFIVAFAENRTMVFEKDAKIWRFFTQKKLMFWREKLRFIYKNQMKNKNI